VVESLPLRALFERADPGREPTAVVIDDESSPDSPLERDEFELPLNAADAVRILLLDTERLLGLALARGDLSGLPKTFFRPITYVDNGGDVQAGPTGMPALYPRGRLVQVSQ